MKSVKLDKKREWYEERVRFNKRLITKASTNYKRLIQNHFCKETMKFTPLYETPKTFDDQGVAYNDGSWVVYKTIKNKKTTIFCKTKNKLLRTFISYMGFLKVAGIYNASVMYLFTLIFMDRLKWNQGLFDCTTENKKWLQDKILKVLAKSNDEITKNWTRNKKNRKGCWDYREFAIDTSGMSKSEVTRKQNKVMNKKEKLDKTIEKYYDAEKSIRKNYEILKENGVKCSKSRLGSWVKEHNESVQNGDTSISEIKTQSVQNGDTSIKSEQENDENGVSKTVHNSSYKEKYYKKEEYSDMTDNSYELDDLFKLLGA